MPLSSVENLPSTLAMHQPSSVRSVRSPHVYPAGRTPGGPLDILSPGSVTSIPPKSVSGKQLINSALFIHLNILYIPIQCIAFKYILGFSDL